MLLRGFFFFSFSGLQAYFNKMIGSACIKHTCTQNRSQVNVPVHLMAMMMHNKLDVISLTSDWFFFVGVLYRTRDLALVNAVGKVERSVYV